MGGTDEGSQSQSMHPPLQPSMTSGPSRTSTQVSQRSHFQEIPHDISPRDLSNDASTTTSGKKTSEGFSTQATNGTNMQSSLSPSDRQGHDADVPDTQRNTQETSSEEWPHSQAHGIARGALETTFPSQSPSSSTQSQPRSFSALKMPVSKHRSAGLANLLNDSPTDPNPESTSSSQNTIILDQYFIDDLLHRLVNGSSGCSIEQLEQINRELMEQLWKQRGNYNRNQVANALIQTFNETILDIEEMQRVLAASQETMLRGQ